MPTYLVDFRGQRGTRGIRLSQEGEVVQFGYEEGGEKPARFDVGERRLVLNPPADSRLTGPVTELEGLHVTDWVNSYEPKLNGTPLALDKFEMSRSLTIDPNSRRILLGTEWWLRLFNPDGRQQWKAETPGAAWAVNISGNGRLAVAGFSDGTLRWYRLQDGKELLALFAHPDGERWIAWTPQGYYQASVGAEDLIGWHVNRGADKAPDFYRVSRFREQFYRPDVMARVLDTLDVEQAVALANKARGIKTVTPDVRAILPPTVTILEPIGGAPWDSERLVVLYQAESTSGAILATEARVNGRPATVLSRSRISGDDHTFIGRIDIQIPAEDVEVTLLAKNTHGWSDAASVRVNWTGEAEWYKPELYVLAIGVSHYDNPELNLAYAAKDAEDFAKAIKPQEGGLYKKVTMKLLTDEKATRIAILDGLDWLLHQTTSRDVAMVFLSGHGITGPDGEYRFLPADVDEVRLKRTSIRGAELIDFLDDIAGKAVMFLDTCHSGQVFRGTRAALQADIDKFANELATAENGVIVFTSSSGKQLSKEGEGNGVFTKALLEGMKGKADYTRPPDRHVSTAELEEYVSDRVKALTDGAQTPMTAKPKSVADLKIVRLP